MSDAPLFQSFFLGGFESSTHRLRSGKRLDVIAATQHDRHAAADYRQLADHGIRTVRDAVRWHLLEPRPGHFDPASLLPQLRAAEATGTQVIWDLCHYGWPDDLDIFSPAFVERFVRLCGYVAHVVREESDAVPFYAPINEISFLGWGGGDVGYLNPFAHGRGFELKTQLVRAAVAGMEAIWAVEPRARMVHVDPLINIVSDADDLRAQQEAERYRQLQYQAWDMLSGRLWPQLGGDPKYLDIVGLNYYSTNQWIHGGPVLGADHPLYRPVHQLLIEVHERYGRPMLIAETGIENDERPAWLRYIGAEARLALAAGVPLHGLCLYPVANHPGWDDDRYCHNGLLDYCDDHGVRLPFEPLAAELARQQELFAPLVPNALPELALA